MVPYACRAGAVPAGGATHKKKLSYSSLALIRSAHGESRVFLIVGDVASVSTATKWRLNFSP